MNIPDGIPYNPDYDEASLIDFMIANHLSDSPEEPTVADMLEAGENNLKQGESK